jgi:hypothetical protein
VTVRAFFSYDDDALDGLGWNVLATDGILAARYATAEEATARAEALALERGEALSLEPKGPLPEPPGPPGVFGSATFDAVGAIAAARFHLAMRQAVASAAGAAAVSAITARLRSAAIGSSAAIDSAGTVSGGGAPAYVKQNTFEGGSDGVTISEANSGGASGDAFDAVSYSGNGVLEYDTGRVLHGMVSARHYSPGTVSSTSRVKWTYTGNSAYVRFYVYLPATLTTTYGIFRVTDSAVGVQIGIRVNSSGVLQVIDAASTAVWASSALTTDAWHRVELWYDLAAGDFEARIFSGGDLEGATPSQSGSSTTATLGTGPQALAFGMVAGSSSAFDFNTDSLAYGVDDWLGAI